MRSREGGTALIPVDLVPYWSWITHQPEGMRRRGLNTLFRLESPVTIHDPVSPPFGIIDKNAVLPTQLQIVNIVAGSQREIF